MRKKALILSFFISLCFSPISHAQVPEVMGINSTQWTQDLKIIGGDYDFSDDFLTQMNDSANELKLKRSAEHYEDLGSKIDSPKDKRKKNPLLHMRPQKVRSAYLTDLKLDKHNYDKLIHYIPFLGNYYSEKHIAQMLPYIALCLNYEIKDSEINYYVKQFVKKETPIDIACQRLYNVVEQET